MRFRLGINYGQVSVENDRWFGEAINVAARSRFCSISARDAPRVQLAARR